MIWRTVIFKGHLPLFGFIRSWWIRRGLAELNVIPFGHITWEAARMPLLFLERFPWPSLQTYTALSSVLLAGTILSAYTTVRDSQYNTALSEEPQSESHHEEIKLENLGNLATNVLLYLITDTMFVWVCKQTCKWTHLSRFDCKLIVCHVIVAQVMVNTACCILMLIAKVIQCIVFGPLRVSEKQVRFFWECLRWKCYLYTILDQRFC